MSGLVKLRRVTFTKGSPAFGCEWSIDLPSTRRMPWTRGCSSVTTAELRDIRDAIDEVLALEAVQLEMEATA